MAGVELTSPRKQALVLLHSRTLEQHVNLVVGPSILGRRGPRKPTEQGHRSSDVLARTGKVWEAFIIRDDPLVHVAGHGARAPTVSMVLNLMIELRVFLLELESCFLEL